jgi:hypothetical protein
MATMANGIDLETLVETKVYIDLEGMLKNLDDLIEVFNTSPCTTVEDLRGTLGNAVLLQRTTVKNAETQRRRKRTIAAGGRPKK